MIVERIEAANLAPTTYRTARRLLDLANPQTGAASLSHDQLRSLAGTDADGTARRHLIELQAAGIIHYRRNSDVQVWFADWAPDNVISGDHGRSTVITGDHDMSNSRGGDHDVITPDHKKVITGDHDVSKLITSRANCSPGDHLPHTHVRAQNDGLTDPLSNNKISQSVTPGPEEQAQSVALLRAIKVTPQKAEAIASTHPFERVRCCVAAWWMNRKAHGGKLQNGPGVVVHWLDEWPNVEPNEFDDREWRRSELYLAHRTPAEIVEDETPPPEQPVVVERVRVASPYLDNDPGWLALESDPELKRKLAGLVRIDSVDGVPLYVYAAMDAWQVEWLRMRCSTQLRKRVGIRVEHPVLVDFVAREDTGNGKPT